MVHHRWVEGNALDLPFSDSYFDAITIGYGLRNVVDRLKAMEEMYRVLKPGSKVSVLDFNKSTDPFSASIQVLVTTYKFILLICQKPLSPIQTGLLS